jgi:hypothetical protein
MGMAPGTLKRSLGRKGSTSEYPPGAFEQYLAVARVMKRGRDVTEAALMLIANGGLPTSEGVFRQALDGLFDDEPVRGDPLDIAEKAYVDALADPEFSPLGRVMRANITAAGLTDNNHAGQLLDPDGVVEGALVSALAAIGGRPLSAGAPAEMAAAWGLLGPETSRAERLQIERYIEALYEDVLNLEALREAAQTVPPLDLQAAIRIYLGNQHLISVDLVQAFPSNKQKYFTVIGGLAIAKMQSLGGEDWFNRAVSQ